MRFWGRVAGSVAFMPNASCLEENQAAAKTRTICPRAAWESSQCPKKALWCAVPLLQSHKHSPEPFTGNSSWHFESSQGAVRGGSYQAVFGGCRLCYQWWWCNRSCGSTSSTCLHGGTWARWAEERSAYPFQWGNILWVVLFRHKRGSAVQHYCSYLWPKAHLYPAL